MKNNRSFALLLFMLLYGFSLCAIHAEEVINMQHIGIHEDHEYFVPADMPDVYYDDVTQTIIIDGGGEVTYYDVEIYPAYSAIPVITTQVSGTYDTIDVSSLLADDYDIIIYSPTDNEFEGEFTIE